MDWFVWMWDVALSLANTEARPSGTPGRKAVYSQNRDGYHDKVQVCGREGGRSEVLWDGRVLCGCEIGCAVLQEHGVGSGERGNKQSRCRRAPVVQGERPPPLVVA